MSKYEQVPLSPWNRERLLELKAGERMKFIEGLDILRGFDPEKYYGEILGDDDGQDNWNDDDFDNPDFETA